MILLNAEDDHRRYTTDSGVLLPRSRRSGTVTVIRPASATKPVPALLEFTARGAPNYAMDCAAHGYAGIVAISAAKRKYAARSIPLNSPAPMRVK